MQKYFKRMGAFLLGAALMVNLFSGCTKSAGEPKAVEEGTGTEEVNETGYPIVSSPLTLKIWTAMNTGAVKVLTNYKDMEMYKEMEKRTGIHLEFIHPPVGQEKESLNLMIASRELPDIIENNLGNYGGGIVKAHADGLIISLNELIEKNAPNYKKALANSKAAKDVLTDDGKYLGFYELRALNISNDGPIIRKDILDELGLKVPVTMDDWYNVLKAFKDQKGIKVPFTGDKSLPTKYPFTGAYGIIPNFIQENNTIKYGPIDSRFKEYLITMRKWYAEGLIDPEFATNNSKTIEAKMTSGQSAAMIGFQSGNIAGYMTLVKPKNPEFTLVGAPYPVLKTGESPKFSTLTGFANLWTCAVITTACKYPKEAARLLDYGYTEEGILLGQFGIEGVSYTMENGQPKLTELITKSPEGISTALFKYSRGAGTRIPTILHNGYAEQIRVYKEQGEAIELWSKPENQNALPAGISLTPEETSKTASKFAEIDTYRDEMVLKFIMGQESLDKFDAYVENIKKMGIADCIKVRQNALDRYNKR